MKKILLLSTLLFGIGISNATIAQQKAPLPKKGSEQVVPDYKKPTQVSAPKSNKPTDAPKGEVKSTGSAAATPNTIKPGKGSAQMVPDYKKPTHLPATKGGKPINAPKTAAGVKPVSGTTKPTGGIKPTATGGKPTLPSKATPITTIKQKPKGDAITNNKGQQGPKPGKGSVQMVPDYKKPTHLPATKGDKPVNAPKAGKGVKPISGTTKPTGGVKPAPTTTKPTGGVKPAPTTTKPTGGVKPAPTTTKPVVLKPQNNKTPQATVEIKGKSKSSNQVVPDYKNAAKKPK